VGGWIAFRIPIQAHVESVTMSAGFDKKTAKGEDLFAMNHRIRKVRISRNGTALREATLDAERRTPPEHPHRRRRRRLPDRGHGGRRSTKKDWRELTVSELAVWGEPGAASLQATHLPRVVVGGLDVISTARRKEPGDRRVDGPYLTLAAFCTNHEALMLRDSKPEKTNIQASSRARTARLATRRSSARPRRQCSTCAAFA
jgi:hypothetical protein